MHSTLATCIGYTSLELEANYLRPIHGGTVPTAHGWVTKRGRRVAFAEGDIRDPGCTFSLYTRIIRFPRTAVGGKRQIRV